MSITRIDARLDLAAVARDVYEDRASWEPLVRFDTEERWYARLHAAADYEVWLLSWLPGQGTGIHDHGGSAGAMVGAIGTLREHAYSADGWEAVREIGTGQVRPFGKHHVHEVLNAGTEPAVSIHVYGPALVQMSVYELLRSGLVRRATERVGLDW